MTGGSERADDQRSLQAATYPFYLRVKLPVVPGASPYVIEDTYEITDVVADILGVRRAPVVHVDEFDDKGEPLTFDDDIIIMKVTVIFTRPVNLFDPGSQGMEQVQSFKGCKPFTWLARYESAK